MHNKKVPFKSHISSHIDGNPTIISSVSIVIIVNPACVNKFPISLTSVNGEMCGAIPPPLSRSANCKDPLQKISSIYYLK